MVMRKVDVGKSRLRENAETLLRIYAFSIAFFSLLALGADALVHFVNLAPYAGFPWMELRFGIALGVAAPTVVLIFAGVVG
jgi:hypothetical protein